MPCVLSSSSSFIATRIASSALLGFGNMMPSGADGNVDEWVHPVEEGVTHVHDIVLAKMDDSVSVGMGICDMENMDFASI